MVVRKARLEDAGNLARLLKRIGWFASLEALPDEAAAEQVKLQLAGCLTDPGHSIYVAEAADGELAGYVSAHWIPYLFMRGPEGYVSELFVAEGARGQGIGRRLLETVQDEAARRGAARLSLINLRHRESYQRRFYVKAGWEERKEAANFVRAIF